MPIKIVALAVLASSRLVAAGIDAASMLQSHPGFPVESMRHVSDDSAQSFEEVPNMWMERFPGQESFEKELMANSSRGEVPGVMRMLSSGDEAEEGGGGHNDRGHNGRDHNGRGRSRFGHKTVWIPAQSRSGSTLLMDMLSVPVTFGQGGKAGDMNGKFVLFEPCHQGDFVNGTVWWDHMYGRSEACSRTIELLANCDFSKIVRLSGWDRNQSQGLPDGKYNAESSTEACKKANLVVFKSVYRPDEGAQWVVEQLKKNPSLMAVQNVRDPRSIMASQMKMFDWTDGLLTICKYYESLIGISHPRLQVVQFEDMIRRPYDTMRKMYRRLHLQFGKIQNGWIWNRFGVTKGGAHNCSRGNVMQHDYTTCSRNVDKVVNKWKKTLTEEDLQDWSSPSCKRVADAFGYK